MVPKVVPNALFEYKDGADEEQRKIMVIKHRTITSYSLCFEPSTQELTSTSVIKYVYGTKNP